MGYNVNSKLQIPSYKTYRTDAATVTLFLPVSLHFEPLFKQNGLKAEQG
jgi:hypothetical protein